MEQLKPGTKLNNRYRIIRFLGQGGFAFTYEAVQESLNLKVCKDRGCRRGYSRED